MMSSPHLRTSGSWAHNLKLLLICVRIDYFTTQGSSLNTQSLILSHQSSCTNRKCYPFRFTWHSALLHILSYNLNVWVCHLCGFPLTQILRCIIWSSRCHSRDANPFRGSCRYREPGECIHIGVLLSCSVLDLKVEGGQLRHPSLFHCSQPGRLQMSYRIIVSEHHKLSSCQMVFVPNGPLQS